jgi:Flp pilus assembly protein TadG
MRAFSKLVGRIRNFRHAEAGVAAVEFAMILPIMLFLYIGMVEGSTLISMDRKIQTVSGAVGDLVARSDGKISKSTLNDYVKVASGIMTPYPDDELVQIVSQIAVSSDGSMATVDWSQRYVGQVAQGSGAHSKGSNFTLPAEVVAIAKGQYVIVTEASQSYSPLYGIVFDQAVDLYRENFYMPRFRERIELN